MHVCTHRHTHAHRHTDTQTQTHRHTDTHTHTPTHTHTHTQTHTYTQEQDPLHNGIVTYQKFLSFYIKKTSACEDCSVLSGLTGLTHFQPLWMHQINHPIATL